MKFGHMVKYKGEYYQAGADVPMDAHVNVEVTDNADGSVNAYDAEGNVVGTVDAETVAELQEQDKTKRGRKTKEV